MRSRAARAKKFLFVGLKLSVTAALCAWLCLRIRERDGFDALFDRIGSVSVGWIAIAAMLHFAAVLAGVLRWRVLLDAARIELPLHWLARSFLIGRFVGAFTPSTTGLDGWRIWDAGRASGSMGASAAAVAIEKLVGLIGMALVCAALVPLGGAKILGAPGMIAALSCASFASIGIFLLAKPKLLSKIASRAPAKLRPRADKIANALSAVDLDRRTLVSSIALGLVSHAALSAVFFATARALHLDVDAAALLAVGNAIVVAVLLPISIGGVGVRESVAVVLLAGAGVGSSDAVLVALLGYAAGQLPALLGGIFFAARRSRSSAPIAAEQTL